MEKNRMSTAGIRVLFCIVAIFFGVQALQAEPQGKNTAHVVGKAPNCIIITDYRFDLASNHVLVTPSSSIIDVDGQTISLSQLKVPCEARIHLHKKKKEIDAELIRLQVKQYDSDASSRFTQKEPFVRYPE